MLATALSSLVVIIVLHYLYIFLRDALTVPKIRDMVRKPQARCMKILGEAAGGSPQAQDSAAHTPMPAATLPDKMAMQAELGAFLRDLKRDSTSGASVHSRSQMG